MIKPMPPKFYAGNGARKTPNHVLKQMREYAAALAERGYTCRSGGQPEGADAAFEEGTRPYSGQMVVYLPWRGFGGHLDGIVVGDDPRLREISARFHPNWAACSEGARKLLTRNAPLILGHDLPMVLSEFELCWTDRALGGGGTGQAIRIARAYGVPVYDLANPDDDFERTWLH